MKRCVILFVLLACLGCARAARMPQGTTQWVLASQVFQATASTITPCPAVLRHTSAQRVCAATLLPAGSFRRLSQVVLGEYLDRGTLVALGDWSRQGESLARSFLLLGGGWTIRYQRDDAHAGPRRMLVVVSYFPRSLTSPLLRVP